MTAQGRLANRHPDVLLITQSEEEVHGAVEVIKEQFESFRCLLKTDAILEDIKQLKPKVLLFALPTVKENITLYTLMIKSNVLLNNHYSVLLCNNKESSLAFGCCLKNLFNSYFVYLPLYEKYRLKLIIYEGLIRCEVEDNFHNELLAITQNQDKDLSELIEIGANYKEQMLSTIEKGKEQVEKIREQVATGEQAQLKREIMDQINTDHLQPLLASLESAISNNLVEMMEKIATSQADLSTKSKPAKRSIKPLDIGLDDINDNTLQETEVINDKHILIVEDNHIYREMISEVLMK